MYIRRHAEQTVEKLLQMFGAVLVAGPRQVGKTTMLERVTENIEYVTLAPEESSAFTTDS